MKQHTLFCIPYAGGNKNIFSPLTSFIDSYISIKPLELPGHGTRFSEPLLTSIEDMAEDIAEQIIQHNEKVFSILGYSMGSVILYEVYFKLKEYGFNIPQNIIICSKDPIGYYNEFDNIAEMENETFKNFIRKKGATHEEILSNDELWEIVSPILKADFIAIDNYKNFIKRERFHSSLYIFFGEKDNINNENLYRWSLFSSQNTEYKIFNGDHFFLFDNYKEISDELNSICKP